MNNFIKIITFLGLILVFTPALSPVFAQTGPEEQEETSDTPTRIEGEPVILNSMTLRLEGRRISLIGLNEAITRALAYDLIAQQALSELIGTRPVVCVPLENEKAQCFNARGQDLSLALLSNGYGFLDRPAIAGQDFTRAYESAARTSQGQTLGLWEQIKGPQPQDVSSAQGGFNQSPLIIGLLAAMILVSLGGMILIALIQYVMLGRLIKLQRHQMASTQRNEKILKDRERFVVSAALEGEVNTNKAKLDAFLIIYEELLRSLKDTSKQPKYKGGGDIVHEKPSLTRSVYDSNLDKLELLGTAIVGDLTKLYVHIDGSPDYITLEPDMPVEQAIAIVEKVVDDAQALRDPMDQIAAGLGIIVREKNTGT